MPASVSVCDVLRHPEHGVLRRLPTSDVTGENADADGGVCLLPGSGAAVPASAVQRPARRVSCSR